MLRGVLIAFAILGFTGCGQSEKETADVGAAGAASASPYAGTCLEMAAAQNWAEAGRLCAMALNADPNDEKVKAALDAATAALASEPKASDALALPSGEAAEEAADEAAEQAKGVPYRPGPTETVQALPAPPYPPPSRVRMAAPELERLLMLSSTRFWARVRGRVVRDRVARRS
jgi:hypothetical protein